MTFGRRRSGFGFITLAFLAISSAQAGQPQVIAGTPANQIADEVFHRLLATPLGNCAARPYDVKIIEERHPNAYIAGNGELVVTTGLAEILGTNRGAWAAVLAHEIGHMVIAPGTQKYLPRFQAALETAYFQNPAAHRDDDSNGALRIVSTSRTKQRELEADHVGLMMMAEAGYHPDFAIALYQQLQEILGDGPRFMADHPRWSEREARLMKARGVAVAIFESRWPNAADSEGGVPPSINAKLIADDRR